MNRWKIGAALTAVLGLVFLVQCSSRDRVLQRPSPIETPTQTTEPHQGSPSPSPTPSRTAAAATVLAAGDIGSCGSAGDEATARILARVDGIILALGDLAYDDGDSEDFAQCFEPNWGRHRDRMRPVPGNHEYGTEGAQPYFDFFGPSVGRPGEGWYSYDLGGWHFIALNSNCDEVGCDRGSAQERWLRADLRANSARCTLAYWHHARFSSGTEHGSSNDVAPFWRALYDAEADVVLVGHEHNYERFAPLDPQGRPDPNRGIRQFVVGTGGRSHYPFGDPLPGSEVRDAEHYGVLELALNAEGYEWRFIPAGGTENVDSGTGTCH